MVIGGMKGAAMVIHLTPEEGKAFLEGKKVTKESGDSKGEFRVELKIIRKRKKAIIV